MKWVENLVSQRVHKRFLLAMVFCWSKFDSARSTQLITYRKISPGATISHASVDLLSDMFNSHHRRVPSDLVCYLCLKTLLQQL